MSKQVKLKVWLLEFFMQLRKRFTSQLSPSSLWGHAAKFLLCLLPLKFSLMSKGHKGLYLLVEISLFHLKLWKMLAVNFSHVACISKKMQQCQFSWNKEELKKKYHILFTTMFFFSIGKFQTHLVDLETSTSPPTHSYGGRKCFLSQGSIFWRILFLLKYCVHIFLLNWVSLAGKSSINSDLIMDNLV